MPPRHSPLLTLPLAALLASALFLPLASEAATCCRCKLAQATGGDVCITDDNLNCASLASSPNPDLNGAACNEDKATAHCAKVPQGVCLNDPAKPLDFKLASVSVQTPTPKPTSKPGATDFQPINLQFNVDIPGMSKLDQPTFSNNQLSIPYMAQYIAAIQKLSLGFGLIAAAIMIVWGGFKYIVSGTGAGIQDGKQILIDALIGLVILLSAYVILVNINPNTATLQSITMDYVRPDYDTTPTQPMNDVSPGVGTKSNLDGIVAGAKKAGADPCNILAFCEHETGLRQIWNGWTGPGKGNPKEKSFSWGACSADAKYIRDGSTFDKKLREAFPDVWPALGTDLPIPAGQSAHYESMPVKAELMINNSMLDGYLAGLELKTATLDATANAGIGSGNIKRWRLANNCMPQKALTLAQAAAMGIDEALKIACLPEAAAGGKDGCPNDLQNCSPVDESKINTPTRGYKMESSGTIHGKCKSSGNQCFTIWTIDHVKYAVKSYARFNNQYHCSK